MMKAISVCLLVLMFHLSAWAAAPAPDFSVLKPIITDIRTTEADELTVLSEDGAFKVLHTARTALSAAPAREELEKSIDTSLRYDKRSMWVVYSMSPYLRYESDQKGGTWRRVDEKVLVQFTKEQWPNFVRFLLTNGLNGFIEIRREGALQIATLTFAPLPEISVGSGNKHLALSRKFIATMRLSARHKAASGTGGFVVVVHDPHQDVDGRFLSLTGIRELLFSNQNIKFRFLVEGFHPDETSASDTQTAQVRPIAFNGLDATMDKYGQVAPQISAALLARFAINVPLAYRLRYARHLPAEAIDNNKYLRTAANAEVPFPSSALEAFVNAAKDDLTEENSDDVSKIAEITALYIAADTHELDDEALVKHYGAIAEQLKDVVAITKRLPSLNANYVRQLSQAQTYFQGEETEYRYALKRNEAMATAIVSSVSKHQDEVPIAFIGSFHTQGIVRYLNEHKVGYVVIEPRTRFPVGSQESDAFQNANHGDTRRTYFQSLNLNMGYTTPTDAEVQGYIRPQIDKSIDRFTEIGNKRAAALAALKNSQVDAESLGHAIDSNGSLALATVSAGGNGSPPPPEFRSAFAFFEPGSRGSPGGEGGSVVILHPDDARWKDGSRYDLLAILSVKNNMEIGEASEKMDVGHSVMLYALGEGKRIYGVAYDPQSRRSYLFEGGATQVVGLVPAPEQRKAGAEINIRTQVVEVPSEKTGESNGG